jgi:hypothetical protein
MTKESKSKHPWPTPTMRSGVDPPQLVSDELLADDDRSQSSSIKAIRGTRSIDTNNTRGATLHDRKSLKTKSKDSTESEGTLKNPIWVSDNDGESTESGSVLTSPSRRTVQTAQPSFTSSKRFTSKKSRQTSSSKASFSSRSSQQSKGRDTNPINLSKKRSATSQDTRSVTSRSSDASSIKQLSEMEDAILESELKEIALSGRSAMIGAQTKKDVEAGDGSKHSRGDFVEDEADKSWHGTLPNVSKEKAGKRRFMIASGIFGVALLISLILAIYYGVGGGKEKKEVKSTEPSLNSRQQAIHSIIAGVTHQDLLNDPASPQFSARQWILFGDETDYEVSVERVIQRYALSSFYFATGGQTSWMNNNWLKGDECGTNNFWHGLSCNFGGQVRAIVLGKKSLAEENFLNGLFGYLPSNSMSLLFVTT